MSYFIEWAKRKKPDFQIGMSNDPYLNRWYFIPRNRIFNIYIHEIRKSDDDRAFHDHPWFNLSILLQGEYLEQTPHGLIKRNAGSKVFRSPWAKHILHLFTGESGVTKPCWTLFITGPKMRTWGFWCPKGFVPWHDFVEPTASGQIGKGCGA